MATYLLTWNPKAWHWSDLNVCVAATRSGEGFDAAIELPPLDMRWSTGVTKRILENDRCFLMRLGVEPKGIMGSGFFDGPPYKAPSFSGEPEKMALFSPIRFDALLYPILGGILSLETLKTKFPSINWTPQASGQTIPDSIAPELEILWRAQLIKEKLVPKPHIEGDLRRVISDRRERNPEARRQCIDHYKLNCAVCDFNFGAFYGEIGEGLIHVHHLKPLNEAVGEREVDPIKDLRPVCANCHQVIHRRREALTLDEVRQAIGKKAK